jgi:exodeoxyribonuclease-5
MVGGRLYRDIMELNSLHKTRLVWFGDPYQLPPVNDDEVFARTPSVFLNEIHRTQADNPILSLAFKIRYGEQYDLNNGFPSFTLSSSFGFDKLKADIQFIAWTNVTRRRINKLARFTRGWTGTDPVAGDYVVCLENKRGMYNGEFFFIKRIDAQTPEYITALISNERINLVTKISLDAFKPDYEASLKAPKKPLTWQERKKLESERENKPILFDFAYCLTCHKSQGSEWPEIAIYDETWKMRDDGMKRRWLYTAVTRTRDKFSTVGG